MTVTTERVRVIVKIQAFSSNTEEILCPEHMFLSPSVLLEEAAISRTWIGQQVCFLSFHHSPCLCSDESFSQAL